MIGNRILSTDDYLAIARRRLAVVVVPLLLAPALGWLVSYAVRPQYVSRSLVVIEGQKVAQGGVKPIAKEDVDQRILLLQQRVLSPARLARLVEHWGLQSGKSLDDAVSDLEQNIAIVPLSASEVGAQSKTFSPKDVPGFYIEATTHNPRKSAQLCGEITSEFFEENLKVRDDATQGTTDFLAVQLDEAKRNLDRLDGDLALFKKTHFGELPDDQSHNLQTVMELNSELETNTQALNRAQQDKSYAESLLDRQRTNWAALQNGENPASLQKQLDELQSQLIVLQGRYTENHPEVQKTEADLAQVKQRLKAMDSDKNADPSQAGSREPLEVQQLELQVKRQDEIIAQQTGEQQRLQNQIRLYQGRLTLSPGIEEQYKGLTRDYETGQKRYSDLLATKNDSQMQADLEHGLQGEQMMLLNPASIPLRPSSPNRLLFAQFGLLGGLGLGIGLAFWLEMRDQSIRTEEDVLAVLDVPLLACFPWVIEPNGERPIPLKT